MGPRMLLKQLVQVPAGIGIAVGLQVYLRTPQQGVGIGRVEQQGTVQVVNGTGMVTDHHPAHTPGSTMPSHAWAGRPRRW